MAYYSGNGLSGPSVENLGVFSFAFLGNAPAEAGPGSFFHVLGMSSRVTSWVVLSLYLELGSFWSSAE